MTSSLAAVPAPPATSAVVSEVEYWKLRALQAEVGRTDAAAALAASAHRTASDLYGATVAEVLTAYGLDPGARYRLTDARTLERVEAPA